MNLKHKTAIDGLLDQSLNGAGGLTHRSILQRYQTNSILQNFASFLAFDSARRSGEWALGKWGWRWGDQFSSAMRNTNGLSGCLVQLTTPDIIGLQNVPF
jgi:hypothetical protein